MNAAAEHQMICAKQGHGMDGIYAIWDGWMDDWMDGWMETVHKKRISNSLIMLPLALAAIKW